MPLTITMTDLVPRLPPAIAKMASVLSRAEPLRLTWWQRQLAELRSGMAAVFSAALQ